MENVIEAASSEAPKPGHPFKVTVLYNGLTKEFEVRDQQLVQQLLEEARQKFGPINNAHLLGLFTQAGVELNDGQTVGAADVKPGDVLLMRPSTVRGG
ncbi:hypothetical protein ABIB73_004290 [Bradyrhizobium sp. F1.4.3]|uniref:hypothetical protein n=1 Tax=Bradyrhizobium sp. F1.4.3 TaxID=3156356 RepID=UPI003395DDF4